MTLRISGEKKVQSTGFSLQLLQVSQKKLRTFAFLRFYKQLQREEKVIFGHKHHFSGIGRPRWVGHFLHARLFA